MSLDEVGRSLPYGEAIGLVAELRREFGSHLNADLNDWDFALPYGELAAVVHAEAFVNVNRAEGSKPVAWPRPWHEGDGRPEVTDEELAALTAQLEARSAFASQ